MKHQRRCRDARIVTRVGARPTGRPPGNPLTKNQSSIVPVAPSLIASIAGQNKRKRRRSLVARRLPDRRRDRRASGAAFRRLAFGPPLRTRSVGIGGIKSRCRHDVRFGRSGDGGGRLPAPDPPTSRISATSSASVRGARRNEHRSPQASAGPPPGRSVGPIRSTGARHSNASSRPVTGDTGAHCSETKPSATQAGSRGARTALDRYCRTRPWSPVSASSMSASSR